jgi:hypothetical protein
MAFSLQNANAPRIDVFPGVELIQPLRRTIRQ